MSNIKIPRRKADVQIDYHDHASRHERPMLNVKVYGPNDDEFAKFETDGHELSGEREFWSWVKEHAAKCRHDSEGCPFNVAWDFAIESAWAYAKYDIEHDCRDGNYFPGYDVKVYQTGRSGGWLGVEGLPPVSDWDAIMLARWRRFAREMSCIVDDVPYQWLWHLYVNVWEALGKPESNATSDAAAELPVPLGV